MMLQAPSIDEDRHSFIQSQQILDDSLTNQSQSNREERRAKSSLGVNLISRMRSKVLGNQKIQAHQMLQQMRTNASSAMSKLHNISGFQTVTVRNPATSLQQLEDLSPINRAKASNQAPQNDNDKTLEEKSKKAAALRVQLLSGRSANLKHRFKTTFKPQLLQKI